jgi:hypothetical protein
MDFGGRATGGVRPGRPPAAALPSCPVAELPSCPAAELPSCPVAALSWCPVAAPWCPAALSWCPAELPSPVVSGGWPCLPGRIRWRPRYSRLPSPTPKAIDVQHPGDLDLVGLPRRERIPQEGKEDLSGSEGRRLRGPGRRLGLRRGPSRWLRRSEPGGDALEPDLYGIDLSTVSRSPEEREDRSEGVRGSGQGVCQSQTGSFRPHGIGPGLHGIHLVLPE